jgi:multidrug efflux pump subunit AcrA (membrane-fusion protein)
MSDAIINQTIKRKRMRKRIRKLVLWLILIALAVGAVSLFVLPKLKAAATVTYDSYTTTRGSISNSMSFSGSIDVINDETLSAEAAGTVRQIYVKEGDSVVAEQRLIRLSNGEILRASFDGEVNDVAVEDGDEVAANESLIEIVDFKNLQVSLRVDEYSMASVSVGQACDVTVTALNQTFESTITHINRIPSGGNSTSYYTVTAEFSGSEDVLPGMQVTVVIPEEEANNAVILSSDALSFGPTNNAYVLMKNDAGEMEQVDVEIGVDNDNYVEIASGLDADVTVYKAVETQEDAGGLFSMFSSLSQSQAAQATAAPNMSNFDPSMMPNRTFDGGSFGGNMP